MKREIRAPLIVAIVLLVVPVLYVGSYLALVIPGGTWEQGQGLPPGVFQFRCYRVGDVYACNVFWPLEQIDRRVRPGAWDEPETSLLRARFLGRSP